MRKSVPPSAEGGVASREDTVISPPIRSVSIFAMVRPRPVPPAPPAAPPPAEWAPREKGSKMRSMSPGAMPGPVSSISNTAMSRTWEARKLTRPAWVNFTALPSTLMRICVSRRSSARTIGGAPCTSCSKCRPLLTACSSKSCTICSRFSRSRMGRGSSASLPPSMRAMSSVPSIRLSRCSPPRRMTPTLCLRCGGMAGSSSSSWA